MLFDKFFETGMIIIGLLWIGDQLLDSFIHLCEIQASIEMREKEIALMEERSVIPESLQKMYS